MPENNHLNGKNETSENQRVALVQWFHVNEFEEAEKAVHDFRKLGIKQIRTNLSWADWHTSGGKKWYDWLIPKLGRELDILPCISNTPPSAGLKPKISAPPQRPMDYPGFVDLMITEY